MEYIRDLEAPTLPFYRFLPEHVHDNPPLCSALQSIETSFFLIALERFPSALMLWSQAIESAIKAGLSISPDRRMAFFNLTELAGEKIILPELFQTFDGHLREFRDVRNRFTHYGFSPRDDSEAINQILKTGFPYLECVLDGFFNFDLPHSLYVELGTQYQIAKTVYADASLEHSGNEAWAFIALAHQVRHRVHPTFLSSIDLDVLNDPYDDAKDRLILENSSKLETKFDPCCFLTCPICDRVNALAAQLEETMLLSDELSIQQLACLNCGFRVPTGIPLLANRVCSEELESERDAILRRFI